MNCGIIQDLLPLYHDGVCSPESRAAVEAHLRECPACREALEAMDAPLPPAEAAVLGVAEGQKAVFVEGGTSGSGAVRSAAWRPLGIEYLDGASCGQQCV